MGEEGDVQFRPGVKISSIATDKRGVSIGQSISPSELSSGLRMSVRNEFMASPCF
jgi:hypothetical protein